MSAPVTVPMASRQLAQELWISLSSLMQSHAAMHSIARPGMALRFTSSDSAAVLLGPLGKLSILSPAESGVGATEFRPEAGEMGDEYAQFFFTEDGLLFFQDLNESAEMEAAVEHFLHKVQA
ncbi:MAG: hypothetical protein ABI164_00020 [Acidobacteriaceae bacterium]